MRFDLDALEALDVAASSTGSPVTLPVDLIDEDPAQPRREFDEDALRALASTIGERGVKQPISVRPHPSKPGRWLVNLGARRLRASKLAGKETIPAFIDTATDAYDQVIENEQREGLKPFELAAFAKRQLEEGVSQTEIARRIGKTRGYMTYVAALIDSPEWLVDLYRSGRCRGLTELYELRKLHEDRPGAVSRWLEGRSQVTRSDMPGLKEYVKKPEEPALHLDEILQGPPLMTPTAQAPQVMQQVKANSAPTRLEHLPRPLMLQARCESGEVTIDLTVKPEMDGWIYVKANAGAGRRFLVRAEELRIVRVA